MRVSGCVAQPLEDGVRGCVGPEFVLLGRSPGLHNVTLKTNHPGSAPGGNLDEFIDASTANPWHGGNSTLRRR
jgi:hypothetical protein